jgi:hypothetical protein
MRFPWAFALAAIAIFGSPVFAGDTTYSRTESVSKSYSASSSTPGTDGSDEGVSESYESSGSSGGDGFMSQCMEGSGESNSLHEVALVLMTLPFRAGFCGMAYGIGISHAHLFVGNGHMDDWDEGRWRFGWGFGVGLAFLPRTAGGLPLELHLEATEALSEYWQLRLRSGAFAHLMSPSVDYRRDVFVDGKRIGSQLDVMTGYIQSGFPFFADGIALLGSHGLYLAGGAGFVALHETIDYTRRKDYGYLEPDREDARWQVLPAMDLGLGRYGGGGPRSFWRFEVRYQAILHFPERLTSFPGDNADVTHSVTWQWAWF